MKKTQTGFIGILAILVIAAAIGGGTYVYTQKKNSTKTVGTEVRVSNGADIVKTQDRPADLSVTEPVAIASNAQAEVRTPDTKKVTNGTVTTTKTIEKDSPNFSYKADIATTEDCGYEDCFKQKFKSCKPAITVADAGMSAVEYKILGKGATGCNVTLKNTVYPDPAMVNKEMTCEFNNKLSFEDSLQKVFSGVSAGTVVCKGSLYDVLRPR